MGTPPPQTEDGTPTARSGRRLAVIVSHPTQYYSPWFRWLQAGTDLNLRVFYLWDFGVTLRRDPSFGTAFRWDVDLLSGYESEFVPNAARHPGAETFMGFNNPGLGGRLSAWRPEALLLFGYKWASHLRAVAWARLHRVPIIFRGDSHFLGRSGPAPAARLALRLLFRQFSAFAFVGEANRSYFRALGVPDGRLFFAPHSVDHTLFDPLRPDHREAALRLRSGLGIAPSTRVVLYAGKLVAAKQPRGLLEAFLALNPRDAALVFVGEGPEKTSLESRAAGDRGRVHFLPFANQSEMPSRYLAADIFALPSGGCFETWGLSVNEAMHMGLPCLVSDRVGCQRDLVTDGVTGWVFQSTDTLELRDKLAAALASAPSEFRPRVAARIAGYTYERTTAGLLSALSNIPTPSSH